MLSNSSKYAIRAVLYLANNSSINHKLGSKKIAEGIDIPAPFLAKIFQILSKGNIIKSTKGPNGGFYLTEKELSNNLLRVIESIDGLGAFNSCFIGLPTCSEENQCAVHHIVVPFRTALLKELTERSIADFAEDTRKGKTFIFTK